MFCPQPTSIIFMLLRVVCESIPSLVYHLFYSNTEIIHPIFALPILLLNNVRES